MQQTPTEENYLKTIFHLSKEEASLVNTNTIANELGTSAASVTDMLKKLNEKELVQYLPYRGVNLTEKGRKIAIHVIRKHRLWEVFLVQKLHFSWDNVHEVAEQLEHINSPELIRNLDIFLGYPQFDPHGDPIPTEEGEFAVRNTTPLHEINEHCEVVLFGVLSTHPPFLQYLDKLQLGIGKKFSVMEKLPFDNAMQLDIDGKSIVISGNIVEKLLVKKV